MKNVYYFILLIIGFSAFHSCKELADEDGNLLNNMGQNPGGLTGSRALFREMTDSDTLEYHYDGLKLSDVSTDSTLTKIVYNSDMINKITFDGFVNLHDSISYTRFFTYDAAGKISTISETSKKYYIGLPAQPMKKYKALYTLKYKTNGQLDSIITKKGEEITAMPFEFTTYSKKAYTFTGMNLTGMVDKMGGMSGSIYGPVTAQTNFEFSDYDDKINPYSRLLPFGFNIHQLLDDNKTSFKSYRLSANNPKKVSITSNLIITPVVSTTAYGYDAQNYVLTGFGLTYMYKPF
ncbi:hypothetical protein [Chryseobacterium sp.]|uniref:hypothetical protein n=1 Tax=Chryseobacterium sp. TaxID=1871047 RepID=UPI0011C75496|nr:hypothetical protein [Chryseobacterium sp.]TXF76216.1 hypothetical protein FUA25_10025 [Chryseobacterium sp.]